MARGVPTRKECTEAEILFCGAYIATADTKAAVLAGWPNHKHPMKYAPKVLARSCVLKELQRLRASLVAKYDVGPERIIQETAAIAFGTLGKFIKVNEDGKPTWNFTGATPEELAAIGELTVDEYQSGKGPSAQTIKKFKISERDRLAALRLLAQMNGMLTETVQHKHKHEFDLVKRLNEGRFRMRQKWIDEENATDIPAQTYTLSYPYVAPKEPHDDK